MMSLDMKCRGFIALALNCWIHILARPVSRYGQVGECMLKPGGPRGKVSPQTRFGQLWCFFAMTHFGPFREVPHREL
jgi:hypothetical protein